MQIGIPGGWVLRTRRDAGPHRHAHGLKAARGRAQGKCMLASLLKQRKPRPGACAKQAAVEHGAQRPRHVMCQPDMRLFADFPVNLT